MRSIGLLFLIHMFFMSSSLLAGVTLNPLTQVASQLEVIDHARILVDETRNPAILCTSLNQVYYTSGFDGFASVTEILESNGQYEVQDFPAFASESTGVTYVVFREQDNTGDSRILWTNNRGGGFKPPEVIPESACPNCDQLSVSVLFHGDVLLAWSQDDDTKADDEEIYLSRNGQPPERFSLGANASFCVDRQEVVHVAYIREGDLFYTHSGGEGFMVNEVRVTETTAVTEFSPKLELTASGTPLVLYFSVDIEDPENPDNPVVSAFFRTLTPTVKTPELLLAGDISPATVNLHVFPDSESYCASFIDDGSVWLQFGMPGFGFERNPVMEATGDEECLDFTYDQDAHIHLMMVRDGKPYYTNDAPAPVADFTVSQQSGEYPLEVSFENLSTGYYLKTQWDFGDGTYSSAPNPVHEYTTRGVYTVSLKLVGTAGAVSEIQKVDHISVGPKRNHLYVPDMIYYAGQEGVKIPIRVTNKKAIHGFQLAGRYNPDQMTFHDPLMFVDFEKTVSGKLTPEFVAPSNFPEQGYFTLGVVFDFTPPFVGKYIQPGKDRGLVNFVVDISSNINNRVPLEFSLENDVGIPPLKNLFTVEGGYSAHPELHNGTITIVNPLNELLGPMFIRGDVNEDQTISIADCVFILSYLFASDEAPFCLDSADVNDDGTINIGDPIMLLGYQFTSDTYPCMPFPEPGFDATEDDLPACGAHSE